MKNINVMTNMMYIIIIFVDIWFLRATCRKHQNYVVV